MEERERARDRDRERGRGDREKDRQTDRQTESGTERERQRDISRPLGPYNYYANNKEIVPIVFFTFLPLLLLLIRIAQWTACKKNLALLRTIYMNTY